MVGMVYKHLPVRGFRKEDRKMEIYKDGIYRLVKHLQSPGVYTVFMDDKVDDVIHEENDFKAIEKFMWLYA
jgi:hypothetical protein